MHIFPYNKDIKEFLGVFNDELKAVTGETACIDRICEKIKNLIKPIVSASNQVFESKFEKQWNRILNSVKRSTDVIEEEALSFIDESFENLKSAELAFDMLKNFNQIKIRERLSSRLETKFEEILKQYSKDVFF